MTETKALAAEFIGTFALVFVGGGAIIVNATQSDGGGGLVTVALAHGLIFAVMVSATLHISGGQINPAISIALALIRKQSWPQALMFVIVQVVGAVVAAGMLKGLLDSIPVWDGPEPAVEFTSVGATLGQAEFSDLKPGTIFTLEMVATFFLMFVFMGTAVDNRGVGRTMAVGGFAIGLTLAAAILFIGPVTGASLNPARSFGPALIAGAWTMHWVYWTAPICGAAAAAFIYQAAFGSTADES